MTTAPAAARPEVVATDLDGTLLRSDGTLSRRARAALEGVESAGISVVFVTARPVRWITGLADAVGAHGTVICLGGACVLDAATMRPLEYAGFEPQTLVELLADLRAAVPEAAVGLERASGGWFDLSYPKHGDSGPVHVMAAEQAARIPEPVAKLLVRDVGDGTHDPARTARLHATVSAVLDGRATLADAGSPGLAEVLPLGISKASTLARWCARRGTGPESVWAFGDMPNDLPMLRWAGRSFAMANAHPDVRAATTDQAPSNDEDGVAQLLESLL